MLFLRVKELISKDEIENTHIISHLDKTVKKKFAVTPLIPLLMAGAISESRPAPKGQLEGLSSTYKSQQSTPHSALMSHELP